MEAVRTSETSDYYNENTWYNIPESVFCNPCGIIIMILIDQNHNIPEGCNLQKDWRRSCASTFTSLLNERNGEVA
jgi:hypothetical protein